jgi:hypothetical protein
MPSTVYAGAAKATITPNLKPGPVFLAGFDTNRRATAVHDNLYARALALRANSIVDAQAATTTPLTFVLVVCDLIGLLRAEVKAIESATRLAAQDRGLYLDAVVIACTHTHSGPDTIGLWGPSRFRSGLNRDYMEWLRDRVVQAAIEAVSSLQPALLRVGHGEMDSCIRNTRQPQVLDCEQSTLQAMTLDGETIFTLTNLACHPEVMWNDNTQISADYAGATCQELESQVGGTALFASADLGGMMTPQVADHEHTFETVTDIGRKVAAAALAALEAGEILHPTALCFRQRETSIPLDNPLLEAALEAHVLSGLRRDESGSVVTRVSLLDLGKARLVTVPGELLPGPGMHLRRMLGVPYRFLIGLADDELGYLLPSDEYRYPSDPLKPGDHYEETMSPSRYATPLLMEAWAALLPQEQNTDT